MTEDDLKNSWLKQEAVWCIQLAILNLALELIPQVKSLLILSY